MQLQAEKLGPMQHHSRLSTDFPARWALQLGWVAAYAGPVVQGPKLLEQLQLAVTSAVSAAVDLSCQQHWLPPMPACLPACVLLQTMWLCFVFRICLAA
jgi:hypothetical protein